MGGRLCLPRRARAQAAGLGGDGDLGPGRCRAEQRQQNDVDQRLHDFQIMAPPSSLYLKDVERMVMV